MYRVHTDNKIPCKKLSYPMIETYDDLNGVLPIPRYEDLTFTSPQKYISQHSEFYSNWKKYFDFDPRQYINDITHTNWPKGIYC